jgi:hypothetical protein
MLSFCMVAFRSCYSSEPVRVFGACNRAEYCNGYRALTTHMMTSLKCCKAHPVPLQGVLGIAENID